MRFLFLFALSFLPGFAGTPTSDTLAKISRRVVVIPVEEEVDDGLHAFLKRATAEALAEKPDYIVYKVNTFGGELHSAFEIVDLLLSVKQCSTYVFVEKKAISAGALIALACNRMAMEEGSTIGDCAPITQSQEGGIIMLGEKIQSPLRAKFRNLAEINGYPSLLSQAMVTADLGVVAAFPKAAQEPIQYFTAKQWEALGAGEKAVFRENKVLVQSGQLLTLTDQEAKRYGFSQGSFRDFASFLQHKNWRAVKTFATTWSEDLARTIGKFTPLLMLLGFGALYLEFKTPGMSAFGFIGVACLAVAFGAKYSVGLANHTELLLLLAGVGLFVAEIYLFPGTFIAGALGLLLMMIALTLSLQTFTVPDPQMPWELKSMLHNVALTLSMAALAVLIPLAAARWVLPYLPARAQVIANTTLQNAHSPDGDASSLKLGDRGITKTALRPAGKAVFGERTFEVTSRGEFLEAGRPVEICQVQGRSITVRPGENPA